MSECGGFIAIVKFLYKKAEIIFNIIVMTAFFTVAVVTIFFMLRYDRERSDGNLRGKGIKSDPYLIENLEDYLFFTSQFNEYQSPYHSCHVKLTCDIELDECDCENVIGNDDLEIYFAGVFDGDGHCISGLKFKGDYAGLFPVLMGSVQNLRVEDCEFSGRRAGGIAAEVLEKGSISNCFVRGDISGKSAAGICALNGGYIDNCVCDTDVPAVASTTDERICYVYNLRDDRVGTDGLADELNDNIRHLIPAYSYNSWETDGGEIHPTGNKLSELDKISVSIKMSGRTIDFGPFYSMPQRRWILPLPLNLVSDEYRLKLHFTDGKTGEAQMKSDEAGFIYDGQSYDLDIRPYDDVYTLMVEFYDNEDISTLDASKLLYKYGALTGITPDGTTDIYERGITFSGRGNDSYFAIKKGYSFEMKKDVPVAGMEAAKGFNLLSCYRDNCFLTYMYTRDLFRGLSFYNAHDYRPVNLFVNGKYEGLYLLTEKMEISKTSFDLKNLPQMSRRLNGYELYNYPIVREDGDDRMGEKVCYALPHECDDITGGYLMEVTMQDYLDTDSRFVTSRNVVISSKGDPYMSRGQLNYISTLFQDYEDAVASPDGYNEKGVYYADYIDMESFADQWLLYELSADPSNVNSVYYYKDSDEVGDGRIHASWYWDAEHMFPDNKDLNVHYLMRRAEKGADCSVNGRVNGNFWTWPYQHEDFRSMLSKEWKEKFSFPLRRSISDEMIDNSEGAGSFEWYKTLYTDSFKINDDCFYGTDYLKKCDEMAEGMKIRLDCLDEYFRQ